MPNCHGDPTCFITSLCIYACCVRVDEESIRSHNQSVLIIRHYIYNLLCFLSSSYRVTRSHSQSVLIIRSYILHLVWFLSLLYRVTRSHNQSVLVIRHYILHLVWFLSLSYRNTPQSQSVCSGQTPLNNINGSFITVFI